jgi:hypothetical protein
MVTIAAPLATGETETVIPVGGVELPAPDPADELYHVTVPIVPLATLGVVTENVTLPDDPAVRVPLCDPIVTTLWLELLDPPEEVGLEQPTPNELTARIRIGTHNCHRPFFFIYRPRHYVRTF